PTGFYTYLCINSTSLDCYATKKDGGYPVFEFTDKNKWCRGTEKDCQPFSTQQDTRFVGLYWIMD
ncbi:MAG: hypothetical protein J6Q05_00535, partial [Elusimicrobiaceae bacterium]|nr:hypothetical protein [Elusimicrobiaceae bacterium]